MLLKTCSKGGTGRNHPDIHSMGGRLGFRCEKNQGWAKFGGRCGRCTIQCPYLRVVSPPSYLNAKTEYLLFYIYMYIYIYICICCILLVNSTRSHSNCLSTWPGNDMVSQGIKQLPCAVFYIQQLFVIEMFSICSCDLHSNITLLCSVICDIQGNRRSF